MLLCVGTDALQANVVQSAAEQRGWLERRARDDEIAVKLLELNVFCVHHQASLARKPSILSIDNVATALVRMTHSQHTTKFQSRFEAFLDRVAANVDRRLVGQIPSLVAANMENNRRILDMCSSELDVEERERIVNFFNHSWNDAMDGFRVIHWCSGGCCADQAACVAKCKAALETLIGRVPDVPLLYRWKHFEPCVEYAFRGIAVHRLLIHSFGFILCKSDDDWANDADDDPILDADDADQDPGTRQRVRMNKTWKFLSSPDCLATWRVWKFILLPVVFVGYRCLLFNLNPMFALNDPYVKK